jgi:hypothetical protein
LVVARSFGEAIKMWHLHDTAEPDSVELLCGGEPIVFAPGVSAALPRKTKK